MSYFNAVDFYGMTPTQQFRIRLACSVVASVAALVYLLNMAVLKIDFYMLAMLVLLPSSYLATGLFMRRHRKATDFTATTYHV